ncbi:hypothetical protein NQD34_012857 [Periophthalmus magnuspinnatus]|nr:hypothetical protein NQD34_012857 [Periophthalmus magnuspinnatus]
MDLNFYSELSDTQNVDSEFLNTQAFSGYPEENKFSGSGDNYLTIDGGGHPFLSAEHTFHTPSLGDEVFEIPPISLDPDSALNISDAVSHFETPGSRNLVSNMVVEANDPSFASTFFNSGSQGMAQHSLRAESHAEGSVLLSSSALEMGTTTSHFSSSSPMTIDVQLGDMDPGLLGSGQLNTINPSELTLGLGDMGERSEMMPTTPSPAGSLQDEDMDDFKRSVLVDSPVSITSISHTLSQGNSAVSTAQRGGGKPATLASPTAAKKGRRKKDPNEPQKPVSAYALFFRDTQAAIKGQNPNASFGEVSKIVASMWDSLAEEQKQVYKKKTEIAKKGYLKALAAYKANQLSQSASEEMESESTSLQGAGSPSPTALSSTEENAPNIILNTGSKPTATAQSPTITKIIIPKHMLQAGRQVVTVLPGGVRALQPTTLLVSGAAHGPPPLQQMQNAPPPPRLQQMAPAPPRLQAKPSTTQGVSISAAPPPPLQIKIVPASVQSDTVELVSTTDEQGNPEDDDVTEVEPLEEDVMEVSAPIVSSKMVCLRAGCNNPAVDSEDWDKEYCSNECVATHCRDVFQAWCSIRSQSVAAVK